MSRKIPVLSAGLDRAPAAEIISAIWQAAYISNSNPDIVVKSKKSLFAGLIDFRLLNIRFIRLRWDRAFSW